MPPDTAPPKAPAKKPSVPPVRPPIAPPDIVPIAIGIKLGKRHDDITEDPIKIFHLLLLNPLLFLHLIIQNFFCTHSLL